MAKIGPKTDFWASKTVKLTIFGPLEMYKLISRKNWVAEKFWSLHTAQCRHYGNLLFVFNHIILVEFVQWKIDLVTQILREINFSSAIFTIVNSDDAKIELLESKELFEI